MNETPITAPHCTACASTDPADLYGGDQGYTACCNEPVAMWGCAPHCTHD